MKAVVGMCGGERVVGPGTHSSKEVGKRPSGLEKLGLPFFSAHLICSLCFHRRVALTLILLVPPHLLGLV